MDWKSYLEFHYKDLTDLEKLEEVTMEGKGHYLELKGMYQDKPCIIGLHHDLKASWIYDIIDVYVYVDGKKVKTHSAWA